MVHPTRVKNTHTLTRAVFLCRVVSEIVPDPTFSEF